LYLTQGILYGMGSSCMYVIVMAVTPQWFTKNRGIALGIVAGGSGIGGLVLPLIVTPINESLGYAWTYRILGFICLFCDIIACILVKERIPRIKEKKKLSSIVQFNVLKKTNFLLFAIGSDVALFGYFVPFFFIPGMLSFNIYPAIFAAHIIHHFKYYSLCYLAWIIPFSRF
jgi:MFS family permease